MAKSRSSRIQAATLASASRASPSCSPGSAKPAPSPPNTNGNCRVPSRFARGGEAGCPRRVHRLVAALRNSLRRLHDVRQPKHPVVGQRRVERRIGQAREAVDGRERGIGVEAAQFAGRSQAGHEAYVEIRRDRRNRRDATTGGPHGSAAFVSLQNLILPALGLISGPTPPDGSFPMTTKPNTPEPGATD